MKDHRTENWSPGDPIGYITEEVPGFETHPYRGERYDAMVPDTLDIQERARLAVHCMTEATDPSADYEPYYVVHLRTNPPLMVHSSWHGATLPKFMEAVPLMRIVSGSDQNLQVDEKWMEVALKSQGPDGLIYTPRRGRPWALWSVLVDQPDRSQGVVGVDEGEIDDDQLIAPFGNGRTLSAMSLFATRDGGPLWRESVRRLVDGLVGLSIEADDMAYYWPSIQLAKKDPPPDGHDPMHVGLDGFSRIVHGLVHAHRLLDYEPALDLARKHIAYMRRYFFRDDGSSLSSPGNPLMCHFHAHTNPLVAMQEYATTLGDSELTEFVVRSYECAKDYVSNFEWLSAEVSGEVVKRPGANLIGYFPEQVNSSEWEGSEICEVSDMIAVALLLSEAGAADYWDDADRWVRNMLAEGQLLSTDWINHLPEAGLSNPRAESLAPSVVDAYSTTDRVPERNLGAFAGWPAANDWYVGDGFGIMHCCTVNGARALYWTWQRILQYEDGKLRVNLLLNRASPWADVDSHIPYQGRVDIRVKQADDLAVRIPEWVAQEDTRCTVNSEERRVSWDGRYAQVGPVKPGNVATLSFPIGERTDVVQIEKQRFTLVRKGNDVVSIDPPGRFHLLYQRQHYREGTTRWRSIERFVSDEFIRW